ncbi:MAG: MGH1-like glycoside hydrolase domain-containing protein [Gemmatimonadales bacterium]
MPLAKTNVEAARLEEAKGHLPWRLWGPYLSERQWGTVREDYSENGSAWDYFPHDHARSRAYRWGEDGLGGFSDDLQRLCLGVALWNGRDPILKERLFGLTNSQGNHGEDVKELYYYLDATPTHSYLRMLYKYPQAAYPYQQLIDENRRRGLGDPEYELLDTGVFDDDRYFDVVIEYAKAGPTDILLRVSVTNRGPEAAPIHVLPQAWFRNTWSWGRDPARPQLQARSATAVEAMHPSLGMYRLRFDGAPDLLFTDNDSNTPKLYGTDAPGPFKDAFHDRVIAGRLDAVNPERRGTKVAAWYHAEVPAGATAVFRARLAPELPDQPFAGFDAVVASRLADADQFYADIQAGMDDPDARMVQRQAFAGMIWSKQLFYYDVPQWLEGDPGQPPPAAGRRRGRNHEWAHLNNAEILSMPDAWEYPWFAAWDLAFHCIPLALIDPEFAKQQLVLLTREWYMHPNGQLPAYEWAFGDVNPPVHAWAAWRVFQLDRKRTGKEDIAFLERVFHKLMLNFTWWVNRKDAQGRNVFQGGFLGLDNIGVFDRSAPLPTGGFINQADGTAWMAMYSLNLMRISLELAMHNRVYEDIATKFFEHFLHIAEAMTKIGGGGAGLWNEEDRFYYDVLNTSDDRLIPLKVRSMVGLIPLFAVETIDQSVLEALPDFAARLNWYLEYRPELAALVGKWNVPGRGERRLLSLVPGDRLRPILARLLDETEFLSAHGVRAISRVHRDHPYEFRVGNQTLAVRYQPGESDSGLFGGNSNWRGPIWMPVNYLLIESLQKFHHYYHDQLMVECPTGSGQPVTIDEAAAELSRRLTRLFLKDSAGRRPVLGYHPKLQGDPHFRDYVLFHEYFHGDTGRGVGASHQTGWTGLVAKLLMPRTVHRIDFSDQLHHQVSTPTPPGRRSRIKKVAT